MGPANRHPAIPQKLPTSKQPTPPAAPSASPPLSSASITLSSLSLNLPYIIPPSQTRDSNLVADKTIDHNHRKKVPQQKARRHAPASPPLVVSDEMTPLGSMCTHCVLCQVTHTRTLTCWAKSQELPAYCRPTETGAGPSDARIVAAASHFTGVFLVCAWCLELSHNACLPVLRRHALPSAPLPYNPPVPPPVG